MAFGLRSMVHGKKALRRTLSGLKESSSKLTMAVPKGCFAVYIGEDEKKRCVVPVSYLNEPAFQQLLRLAEEEFGYDHYFGGITIPCTQDIFDNITSQF